MLTRLHTSLRVDRVLFEQFRQLCLAEKLRTGEALENLVRLAVEVGGVTVLYANRVKSDSSGVSVDEALFRSRLARLKSTLDYEREMLTKTGEVEWERQSDQIIDELVQLGRRAVSKELVKELEALLAESDKLHKDVQQRAIEESLGNN